MPPSESKKEPISFKISGDSLVIRFILPKERNPLSVAVLEELHHALDSAEQNNSLKKIIFTGAEDVFASGANLREIAQTTAEDARRFALRGQSLMGKIAGSSRLTIAAVNGFCFGGALDLALSCEKRIAAPAAVFCHPGANLGIITGWGGTQRLPRLIGEARALEMFFTAARLEAGEALRIGLIDAVSENPLAESLANFAQY